MDDRHKDVPGYSNPGQDDSASYSDEIPYFEYSEDYSASPISTPFSSPSPPSLPEPIPLHSGTKRRLRMRLLYGGIVGVVVLVLALSGTLIVVNNNLLHSNNQSAASGLGTFQGAACPFRPDADFIEGMGLNCGFVTVPEVRGNPQSREIKLAVAIFKHTRKQAASNVLKQEPVIFLDGGPGGSSLISFAPFITSEAFEEIGVGRDLILFDQRGVGKSQPALDCPELGQIKAKTAREAAVRAFQLCYSRLKSSGVNINGYNTLENAADVHALIGALGYKKVDLYGVSYGTRLALTVMRLFPGDLRSVVLDSTVPTQANLVDDMATVTQHAFDVLLRGCRTSASCNKAYPDLENVFYELVDDWNTNPHTISDSEGDKISVAGNDLMNAIWEDQYNTDLIPKLPGFIWQLSKGDTSMLEERLRQRTSGEADISDGMYFSVECGEDVAYALQGVMEQELQVLHPELRGEIRNEMLKMQAICQVWPQKVAPRVQMQPVVSSVPTLILSGEYDPITPLSYAQRAAQTLDHSYLFQFPAFGHGVLLTDSCPDRITANFLLTPAQKPDASCIGQMQEPRFT